MQKSEDLKLKTVKQLREIAKQMHISGRWDMNKTQLVEAIIKADLEKESSDENSKENRISRAEAGLLVAFKMKDFKHEVVKLMTGKIVENKQDYMIVETRLGTIKVVEKEDVVWVKTGKRWPKQIYSILRNGGIYKDEA